MDYDAWLDRQLYEYDRERELAEREEDCQEEEEDLDYCLQSMLIVSPLASQRVDPQQLGVLFLYIL